MSSSSSAAPAPALAAPAPAAPAVAPIDVLADEGNYKLGKATKLMLAAASGSIRTLEKVLRQGARVDIVNEHGFNAMHFAAKAKNNNSDVIRELNKQGLSVRAESKGGKIDNVMCDEGFTPLHVVENAGSATTLIELGADPDSFGVSSQGSSRGSSVFIAAVNGNVAVLKAMLACGGRITGNHCWYAASQGKAATVKAMLDHGHFDLGYVKEIGDMESLFMTGSRHYPYDMKRMTIAQAAFCTGNGNLTYRKNCTEIIKMLEAAGVPDEVPGAPGAVYGKAYTR